MRSAIPPAHHPSKWTLFGCVIFLCTVLGSDRQSDCKVFKNMCQSVTKPHIKLYYTHTMNAGLTLESTVNMTAQDIHSAFHTIGLQTVC